MSEIRTTGSPNKTFRVTVLLFACTLGSLAVWILAAEVLRPTGIEFTTDAQLAVSNYGRRDAAILAARIGLVRGDLWSKAAFAYGDILLNEGKGTSNVKVAPFQQTQAVTEQAIAYAPHDSRLWLLLAANYFRFDWLNERAAASLKMAYYTGSNTLAVVPERLLLAIQSHAIGDEEFQDLVRHDIRIAVTHKSELMSALVAAYKNAPQSGRQFFEKAVGEIDPSVITSIRSEEERH